MKNLNIESILASILESSSKILLKIIPGWGPLVKISSWAATHNQLSRDEDALIQADYWNGSENDIVNLFREMKHLANDGHNFHGNYLLKRLNFLADEGLNFTDNISIPSYRKLREDEIQVILFNQTEKPKRGRKPLNKRDDKGRFTSKKKK